MVEKFLSLISTPVLAADPPQITELTSSFDNILDYIFPVVVLVAVAMAIYGGYMYIISGGDPAKKQKAQGTLTWSILGLIFVFLIKAILTLVVDLIS